MIKKKLSSVVVAVCCMTISACESERTEVEDAETDLVWAVNIGGPAYVSIDGTPYEAEASVRGGTVGKLEIVKGSQDAFLYEDYREGDVEVARAIADGVYDITFHFAEPEDLEGGERVFDALVEGQRVIDDLDVMSFRDGKVYSALTVTVPDVEISDGELNIEFEASARLPILSALVVRSKNRTGQSWELVWSDEFDYEGSVDPDKWSIDEWPARKVNDEDQAYTARSRNLRVEDGNLIIEAHKEDYDNAVYTSGRVHSSGKGDFLSRQVRSPCEATLWKGHVARDLDAAERSLQVLNHVRAGRGLAGQQHLRRLAELG